MTDKPLNRPLAAVAVPLVGRSITKAEAAAIIAKNFKGALGSTKNSLFTRESGESKMTVAKENLQRPLQEKRESIR